MLLRASHVAVQNGEGARFSVPGRAPKERYLSDDRLEQNNRIDEGLPILAESESLLARHRALAEKTEPARPVRKSDRDTRARLQELGYLQPAATRAGEQP